ncbi:hypothetical protein [Cryobacterium serini]|uniref:NERD domain-containing protein n=1 Tax=Cryobacterium serini TaxID=1259201 RepID=A0A4R9BV41_9MICO|nr:hypothetical protein [Cryobacterium serini]TFD91254.1 hypothetical protein E3T51_00630 [Cryobacterium serini]
MTHILSTRRCLTTPPELPESNRTGAPRPSTGPTWLLGRAHRTAATPTDLALARARSECAVDTLLATLPQHWAAFTLPTLGGAGPSAMRLLVGPGGVLALHAQLCDGQIAWVHRQRVFVAGQRSPNLAVAAAGANQLTMLIRGRLPLRTAVQPALVLLGARLLGVTGRSGGVSGKTTLVPVVGAAALGDWLVARPQVLRPIERMELAAVIDNPLTWGSRPTILPRPGSVGD